jgi:uncharacterized protein YceH (UPF0502 family)
MMLRGPQTTGELRQHSERLHRFSDISSVEGFLDELTHRPAGALVVELPRAAGARETRWAHLLSGPPVVTSVEEAAPAERVSLGEIATLRAHITELREELTQVKDTVNRLVRELGIAPE